LLPPLLLPVEVEEEDFLLSEDEEPDLLPDPVLDLVGIVLQF
jgi:hypothetical protein